MRNWSYEISASATLALTRRLLSMLFCVATGVVACTGTPASDKGQEPVYNVTSSRPSAQVAVTNEGAGTVMDIYSDNGIGTASVKLVSGSWPDTLLMRFHIQGLESLQFHYAQSLVNLSINTESMILQNVSHNGAPPEAIAEDSDFWMPVLFLDREGTLVQNPAVGGIIQVGAPADFLTGQFPDFTINWIDFYR